MRPPWISTIASMSPCRDVPRPRYTPSLYVVLPASLAAGGGAAGGATGAGVDAGAGAVCTGGGALAVTTGAATTGGVTTTDAAALTTGGGAVSTVATGDDADSVAAAGLATVALVAGDPDTATFDDAGAVARPAGVATALELLGTDAAADASTTATAGVADIVVSPDSPAAARDALRGRRSALSAAMRSAAGFVFANPAVYTISTAAEPRATRLLPRALDTRGGGARREARR